MLLNFLIPCAKVIVRTFEAQGAPNVRPSEQGERWKSIAWLAVQCGITTILGMIAINQLIGRGEIFPPTQGEIRIRLQKKIKNRDIRALEFSPHEIAICDDEVDPEDITESFDQIGGLEANIAEIQDNVILPLMTFGKYRTSLASYPTGMLLYGPPGTGKTMIAKAIAKETNAVFISLKFSNVYNKWFGESDKLVAAVFSVARKLAPTIIFIDEIDCFLGSRGMNEHAPPVMNTIQASFLTEWDGLTTRRDAPVLILGATNRPDSIDKAILRRMPCTLRTPLPTEAARSDILLRMLKSEEIDDDVNITSIAERTEGFSGSDLKELCRVASLQRIKELGKQPSTDTLRALGAGDFEYALDKSRPSSRAAAAYGVESKLRELASLFRPDSTALPTPGSNSDEIKGQH